LDASIQVGVGRLHLTVPSGGALNARIKGGVGETEIILPSDAAIHIEARSGVGDVKMPPRLQKMSAEDGNFGLGKSGVWETPNFSSASRQINIRYDGGIGELKVR
jgi:predicted membrane protein